MKIDLTKHKRFLVTLTTVAILSNINVQKIYAREEQDKDVDMFTEKVSGIKNNTDIETSLKDIDSVLYKTTIIENLKSRFPELAELDEDLFDVFLSESDDENGAFYYINVNLGEKFIHYAYYPSLNTFSFVDYDSEVDVGENGYKQELNIYSQKSTVNYQPQSFITGDDTKLSNNIKNGWHFQNGNWSYYQEDLKITNSWQRDSIGWTYLDSKGYMVKDTLIKDSKGLAYLDNEGYWVSSLGWKYNNATKNWLYIDKDGYALTNAWKKDSVDWVYLGSNGYMVKNQWQKDSIGWTYLDSNGYMLKNQWQKDSIGWTYLDSDGYMSKGALIKDSKGLAYLDSEGYWVSSLGWKYNNTTKNWLYIGKDGYVLTNTWKKDAVGWTYLDSNGYMSKDALIKDSKGLAYLDNEGYWVNSLGWKYNNTTKNWLYIDKNGYALTNAWQKDSVDWVYLGSNGYVSKNQWQEDSVGKIYVGSNGYMVKDSLINDSKGLTYLDTNGYRVTSPGWKYSYKINNWLYIQNNGYALTNTWLKDTTGWLYIGENGYWQKEGTASDSKGIAIIGLDGYWNHKYARNAEEIFLYNIAAHAVRAAGEYNLYPSVMMAQAALESGFGKSSLSTPPNHNLFGIKGHYLGQTVNLPTSEYIKEEDKWIRIDSYFRKYPSYTESFYDNAKLLKNGTSWDNNRYSGTWVENTNSYLDATAWLTGRYATDPDYNKKLNSIITQYGLDGYDLVLYPDKKANPTAPIISTTTHTVVSGDTLSHIAQKYNTIVSKLKLDNALVSDLMFVGQLLKV